MGSWLHSLVFTGMVFIISPLSPPFALSLSLPSSSNSTLPFGFRGYFLSLPRFTSLLLSGLGFLSILLKFYKITKTLHNGTKKNIPRISQRRSLASPSTRVRQRLLLMLLSQISLALPRSYFLMDMHVAALWRANWKGVLSILNIANFPLYRFVIMCSQLLASGGVMLAFGPVFAPFVGALFPGKEGWPFPLVETRRPLSLEGTTCSKDISSWGLNLWESVRFLHQVTLSVEASAPPQADWIGNVPSWASGHLSSIPPSFAMTNS